MDYKLIFQILNTVDEVKTISELAERLYLSQPYISQVLAKTERKYKVKLINRNQVPIELTSAGMQLKSDLNILLNDQAKLKNNLIPYSLDKQNFIKIAFTPIWIKDKANQIIIKLQKEYPTTQFEIQRIFTSKDSAKLLKSHNIDIFWGASLHNQDFISNYLYRSRAVLLIPKNLLSPNFQNEKIIFSDHLLSCLNDCPMISLTDDSSFQMLIDHLFEDADITPKKVIKINDYIGAGQLALSGLGFAITLEDTLQYLNLDSNKVAVVKIPSETINLDASITINKYSSNKVKDVSKYLHSLNYQIKCNTDSNRS